jgi:hypothetical protein
MSSLESNIKKELHKIRNKGVLAVVFVCVSGLVSDPKRIA